MNIEYHKWYSPSLGQDMELKVYGYFGKPTLVFPAQGGRFYEFEDFKMVDAIAWYIETGRVKLFTVDSLDNQSWANWPAHPADRARRHEDYDRYIIQEVVPFMRKHCGDYQKPLMTTGCSMGAYHAGNFFFRHPQVFDTLIALSGLFHLAPFVGDYMDQNIYQNSPLNYLPDLNDPVCLHLLKNNTIIACAGQGAWEEPMLADARRLQKVLYSKDIRAWIDIWGVDVNHDWPWWRKMLPYFLWNLSLKGYGET